MELEKTLTGIEEQSQSVVVIGHKTQDGHQGEVMGVLALGDAIIPGALVAVKSLYQAGLEKVVMLSGDNQRTATAIAKQAGIGEAHWDLLPEGKIKRTHELIKTHEYVGMIGDGVNDAPAMAAATIGIAMGGVGTDTAIETADMALMQNALNQVAVAIYLGRRTVGIIRANIIFALTVKAAFLVGATELFVMRNRRVSFVLIICGIAVFDNSLCYAIFA